MYIVLGLIYARRSITKAFLKLIFNYQAYLKFDIVFKIMRSEIAENNITFDIPSDEDINPLALFRCEDSPASTTFIFQPRFLCVAH